MTGEDQGWTAAALATGNSRISRRRHEGEGAALRWSSQAKDQVKVRREGCRGVQQAASTSTAEDEAGTLHLAGTSPPLRSASRVPLPLASSFTSRSPLSLLPPLRLARTGGQDSGASRALLGRASPPFTHLSAPLKLGGPAKPGNLDSSGNL